MSAELIDTNTLPLHLELLKVSSINGDNVVVRGDIVAALCECAQILQEIDASEHGVSIDLDVRIAVAIDKLEALCPSK